VDEGGVCQDSGFFGLTLGEKGDLKVINKKTSRERFLFIRWFSFSAKNYFHVVVVFVLKNLTGLPLYPLLSSLGRHQ